MSGLTPKQPVILKRVVKRVNDRQRRRYLDALQEEAEAMSLPREELNCEPLWLDVDESGNYTMRTTASSHTHIPNSTSVSIDSRPWVSQIGIEPRLVSLTPADLVVPDVDPGKISRGMLEDLRHELNPHEVDAFDDAVTTWYSVVTDSSIVRLDRGRLDLGIVRSDVDPYEAIIPVGKTIELEMTATEELLRVLRGE